MLDSEYMALKDKEQVTKAGDYFIEQLASMAMLMNKSMPSVVALNDTIQCGE